MSSALQKSPDESLRIATKRALSVARRDKPQILTGELCPEGVNYV